MKSLPHEVFCEFAAIKIDLLLLKIFSALSFISGTVAESSVLEMLGASFAGALLMGYAFARRTNPANAKTLGNRWMVNLCLGVPIGLFLTYSYCDMFPKVPMWVLSGLFSGLAGPLMVLLIPIGIPFITACLQIVLESNKAKLKAAVTPHENQPSHNPPVGTSGTGGTNQGDQTVSKDNAGMANFSDGG